MICQFDNLPINLIELKILYFKANLDCLPPNLKCIYLDDEFPKSYTHDDFGNLPISVEKINIISHSAPFIYEHEYNIGDFIRMLDKN